MNAHNFSITSRELKATIIFIFLFVNLTSSDSGAQSSATTSPVSGKRNTNISQSPNYPAQHFPADSFLNKVYIIGPRVKADCSIKTSCDCCTSLIIFFGKNQFIMEEPCVDMDYYSHGRFVNDSIGLILKFDPYLIKCQQVSDSRVKITSHKKHLNPVRFDFRLCGSAPLLFKEDEEGTEFGRIYLNVSVKEEIYRLKKTGVWTRVIRK